jgi:hypothetical protein
MRLLDEVKNVWERCDPYDNDEEDLSVPFQNEMDMLGISYMDEKSYMEESYSLERIVESVVGDADVVHEVEWCMHQGIIFWRNKPKEG